MKIVMIAIMSLGLVACNGGEESDSSGSKAVYGTDYQYDGTHPPFVGVDEDTGEFIPTNINGADVKTECGKHFYKEPLTGDVFYAKLEGSQWVAEQIGYYAEYDHNIGGFQTVGYQYRQIVSVGKYVVMSDYTSLGAYWNWTRINFQHIPSHDNCMVIIDELNQDVNAVDLNTEALTSIF